LLVGRTDDALVHDLGHDGILMLGQRGVVHVEDETDGLDLVRQLLVVQCEVAAHVIGQ
jgi:hypothetical protein